MRKYRKLQSSSEPPEITELDNLTKLITSEEWIEALKVIKLHKEYLQKEMNGFVRAQDLIRAYGALCKLDDAEKIFAITRGRLEALKKER